MFLLTALVSLAVFAAAQDPPTPQEPTTPPAGQDQAQGQRPGGFPAAQSTEPRPYDRVITKDAKSKKGVFTVHQVRDRWYYEIPKSELGKDFLWVTQMAQAPLGTNRASFVDRVVRFERLNNRVLLREIKYDIVASPNDTIAKAVAKVNSNTVLMSFNVETIGKDDAPVIEVSRLLTSDIGEVGAKPFLRVGNVDPTRSFVNRITAYPTNIESDSTFTYSPQPAVGGAAAASPLGFGAARQNSTSVMVHYSLIKLPEKPMMGRLDDSRVGFFSSRFTDFSSPEQEVREHAFITRYRLEKKDPSAAVSEPVQPIVYYIDPGTPAQWVPYIKKAVEAWQPIFEAAGFKHAIIAKDAPTDDPDWSAEDARYSVIKWLPSTTENAVGPNIHDPRSGEILNAPLSVYHNIINLQRAWYFLQVGPLDPRAQKFPIPDDLMGRLIQYVVEHEVGHTIGLQHNMKASSMYEQAKVRDPQWVHTMGHTPSIMDYSRFNYVAQPEDKIPVDDLIPRIGPYDKFAIQWGYTPIPNAKTPDEEKPTLDEWARQQDKTPWFRFSAPGGQSDPGDQTEAVGDADAIKSTALGVKNLERVSKLLMTATTTQKGEPYDDLEEMYSRMLGQWSLEMGHVAHIVGGMYATDKHIGQDGVLYTPVPRERQVAAVKFLSDNALVVPAFFVNPDILRRFEPIGEISRIANAQRRVLASLLTPDKIARLQESQLIDKGSYGPTDLMSDVRAGVWKEVLGSGPVKVDPYRRNLQRAYLDILNGQLNRPPQTALPAGLPRQFAQLVATTEDIRPLFRGELRTLNAAVTAAIPRAGDSMTRMHLEDVKDQIAKILDPKFAPPASPATGATGRPGIDDWNNPTSCWPDYRIEP